MCVCVCVRGHKWVSLASLQLAPTAPVITVFIASSSVRLFQSSSECRGGGGGS